MAPLTIVIASIATLLITILYVFDRKCRIRGFQGPPGVFLLGNAREFRGNFCKRWLDLSKIYGPVFQLWVLNKPFVILNDKESIVECFAKAEASGRVAVPMLEEINIRFGRGISGLEGRQCDEQRHFFIKALKELGMTKKLLDDRLRIDIEALLGHWVSKNGAFFELRGAFDVFIVNSVWSLMSSNRFSPEEASKLMKHYLDVGNFSTWGRKFVMIFPKLGEYLVKEHQMQAITEITKYETKFLKEHHRDRIPGKPRDVLDMLLDKIDATTDSTSAFYKADINEITANMRDVQVGATASVNHLFEWAVLYGCHFPATVRRLQAELDSVIGPSGTPSLNHKEQMPYAEAFVLEVSRMGSVLPISFPHSVTTDFEFRGAVIPKDTLVLSNLYGMNYDPEVWPNPDEFKPERFLDAEGQLDSQVKNRLLTFSTGKHSCIGRVFAEDQTFLVIVSMFHKFSFYVDKKLEKLEGTVSVAHAIPKGVQVRVLPRQ